MFAEPLSLFHFRTHNMPAERFFEGIEAHPHILRIILQHVRNPEPKANSGAQRKDWRQPDLATCMLVSVVSAFSSDPNGVV